MGVFSQYVEKLKLMGRIFSTLNFILLSLWHQLLHLSKLESSIRWFLILWKFYVELFLSLICPYFMMFHKEHHNW